MIYIGWLLRPWYFIDFLSFWGLHLVLPLFLVENFLHLTDNHTHLMIGQFVQIPIWRHHQERSNDRLTIKHQPNKFDVVISILFPKIIGWYIRQFGQPLIYPDFLVFAYSTEIFMLNYLLINLLELLVIIWLPIAYQNNLIKVLLLNESHVLVWCKCMLGFECPWLLNFYSIRHFLFFIFYLWFLICYHNQNVNSYSYSYFILLLFFIDLDLFKTHLNNWYNVSYLIFL